MPNRALPLCFRFVPMTALVGTAVLVAGLAAPAAAQDEAALRSFFEGKRVTVRIDMPGTSDGVDVHADSRRPLDSREYGERLKTCGTAIHAGESVVVTLVKVKKDLIEFQLGGGGFGTFGDDTSTSVYMPSVEKSAREKELERAIRDEDDRHRRRDMERELDELRDRRDRENRRIDAARAVAEERKRARIADERLRGGSRFNVRYDGAVPRGITPAEVMEALSEYVDFWSTGFMAPSSEPLLVRDVPPPADALPRKGMTRAEAERELGRPIETSERREGALTVTTVVFAPSGRHISADFVDDILVRYSITSR